MGKREEEGEEAHLPLPSELTILNLHIAMEDDDGSVEPPSVLPRGILGRSVFAITEPEEDEEASGEKEAYMATILACYRRSLVERTKNHLVVLYHLFWYRGKFPWYFDWYREQIYDLLSYYSHGGYIANCVTKGNLHGILIGREVYPDGVLYASQDSHYSVFKAARMYRMECVKVNTLISGEIDCLDFARRLQERRDKPAIVNVNIGTTLKGAIDDLDLVIKTLYDNGFTDDQFYIHCDGALFGLMMPFVKKAPKVTFKKPIGSVSVSGHKCVGCPIPCGVQITRMEHIRELSRNVEYLTSHDATIIGSRNGHAPIFLWYTLHRKGYRGFQREVQICVQNAHYLKERLTEAGFGAMLNELSSTVVLERPQEEAFVKKWQLACQGNVAHAVVMPNITVGTLNTFMKELVESRKRCFPDGKVVPKCIAEEVGQDNCACNMHLVKRI